MALDGLFCADVPLRNYSLTHLAGESPAVCTQFTPVRSISMFSASSDTRAARRAKQSATSPRPFETP